MRWCLLSKHPKRQQPRIVVTFWKWGLNTEVEEVEEDVAAKDVAVEEAGDGAEEEVKQQAGWMMMNFMQCLRMHEPSMSKEMITTDACCTTISAMITVDPRDQD